MLNTIKYTVTSILFAILTVSCGTVTLTQEAKKVRMIQPDWANACKMIGMEQIQSTSGSSPADCKNKAFNLTLNKVADVGGNAYVITHQSEPMPCFLLGGTTITVEVYKCPEK